MLRKAAVDVGLEPARVDAVLASDEYADAVQADIDRAHAYGATGVPFFVVDEKYGVSGAQPTDVFAQVLRPGVGRAPAEPRGARVRRRVRPRRLRLVTPLPELGEIG